MPEPRFYYVNEESKEVRHFGEQLPNGLEGFAFAGMSQLPVKGAAGYFTKNQPGYRLINGDAANEETQEHDSSNGTVVSAD